MDNAHLPPSGDEEAPPTVQFWPGPAPSGQAGQDSPQQDRPRDRRRALRWSAGVALGALLAGGGAVLGVSLAGNSSSPGSAAGSSPAVLAGSAGAPAGQAAVLNATLNAASSPAGPAFLDSSGTAASAVPPVPGLPAAPAGARPRRCLAARAAARAAGLHRAAAGIRRACRLRFVLRALALRGVHGEFTFRGRSGFKTLAFERGTIQSVSSGRDIVVRAPDGTTWTWDLVSSTVVRESGHKTAASALTAGEQVWAGGRVSGSAKDARLIVIRPPSGSATPAPSPSGS